MDNLKIKINTFFLNFKISIFLGSGTNNILLVCQKKIMFLRERTYKVAKRRQEKNKRERKKENEKQKKKEN